MTVNPVASILQRTLSDGTEEVRVAFKIPSRPRISHAILSVFDGEIVLVQQDKPTEKLPAYVLEDCA
jgi:hypothetical protein